MTYLGRQGGKKGFWGLRCDVAENRFIRKKHLFFRCYNNYNIIHHSLMINRQNLHGKIMKGEILQIGHSLLLWHQQPLHNFGHFILKSSRCFLIESFDANKILASALYKKHGSQEMAISSHCQQILLATLWWCSFYVLGFVCFCEWFWVLQRMDGSWPKTPNINFHHRNENAKCLKKESSFLPLSL